MANSNSMFLKKPIPQATQTIAFLAASARASDPLPVYATSVKLQSTQDCRVEWGGTNESTADKTGSAGAGAGCTISKSMLLKAGAIEEFPLDVGSDANVGTIISVIGETVDGSLDITPFSN